ncbi:hypothetical protein SLEP1_g1849 [Rubroshorea leprosula]|uniref:Uncharacterized protein n=1 Tax=Rubroshorea leprosula TaxID=152421 RepID=A0AAV5HF27_9ROSI|nr:hypothetical protein SLEP1_g1849 [Rubroshorea leprosula]
MDMWVGKLGVSCINMNLQDFYSYHSNYTTRLVLNVRDSKGDVVGAAAAVSSSKKLLVQIETSHHHYKNSLYHRRETMLEKEGIWSVKQNTHLHHVGNGCLGEAGLGNSITDVDENHVGKRTHNYRQKTSCI